MTRRKYKRTKINSLRDGEGLQNMNDYLAARKKILEDIIIFSQRNIVNIFIAFDDTTGRRAYSMNCGDPDFMKNFENYQKVIKIDPVPCFSN